MRISVQADIRQLTRHLNRLQKKQIPFATAKALTLTAKDAQRSVQRQMPAKLDRPRPQTIKALRVKPATKRRLQAEVYFLDWAADFMRYQVAGGTERARGKALVAPVQQRRNKFGNVAGMRGGKKIAALLAKPNVFKGTIGNVSGIWQRYKDNRRKPKLLFAFKESMRYSPRLPLRRIVEGVARNKFKRNFNQALAHALRSAR